MVKITSGLAWLLLGSLLISCSSEDQSVGEVTASSEDASRSFQLTTLKDDITAENRAPCSVDSINGQIATDEVINADRKGELRVVGWAATRNKQNPGVFTVNLVDRASGAAYTVGAATGKPRPDVARVLGAPGLAMAGFDAVFQLDQVVPGTYDVLLAYSSGNSTNYCSTTATVYVKKRA